MVIATFCAQQSGPDVLYTNKFQLDLANYGNNLDNIVTDIIVENQTIPIDHQYGQVDLSDADHERNAKLTVNLRTDSTSDISCAEQIQHLAQIGHFSETKVVMLMHQTQISPNSLVYPTVGIETMVAEFMRFFKKHRKQKFLCVYVPKVRSEQWSSFNDLKSQIITRSNNVLDVSTTRIIMLSTCYGFYVVRK